MIKTLEGFTSHFEAQALREQIRERRDDLRKLNRHGWRREEYREAYKSEEWSRLRNFTIWRARGYCQGCGRKKPHLDVHHVTYDFGVLAPCFALQAICRDCHDRLHDGWWGFLTGPPRQLKLSFAANDNGGIDPALTLAPQDVEAKAS